MGPVLAMYDVRGIQEFIFRSNRIKEIVGASRLIDGLLEDFFRREFSQAQKETGKRHVCDWFDIKKNGIREARPFAFDSDEQVFAEVVTVGGGNMLVAFRDPQFAKELNRRLSLHIIERTYSLSVAIAMVEKSENYLKDYQELKRKMARVKQENVSTQPFGGFPFTKAEVGTGFPIAHEVKMHGEFLAVSPETFHKLKSHEDMLKKEDHGDQYERNMDAIIDKDTGENMLAIVHIDGNDIGRQLISALSQQRTYQDAVMTLRCISIGLHNCFCVQGLEAIRSMLQCKRATAAQGDERLAFRPIVLAGDDVTFVCCAPHALTLTQAYLEVIEEHTLLSWQEGERLTACAGICFVHPHFPFRWAYTLSEELCSSAKTTRKEEHSRGSYIDFHSIEAGLLCDLGTLRHDQYEVGCAYQLLKRPYSLEQTSSLLRMVQAYGKDKIPRSWIKRARDAYHRGENDIKLVFEAAASRGYVLDKERTGAVANGMAQYYDAFEMYDLIQAGLGGDDA